MSCKLLLPFFALAVGLCTGTPSLLAQIATTTTPPPAAGPWAMAHDASPAFTPGGDTVVFTRGSGTARRLYVAHRHDGAWSTPMRAPFSEQWMDFEPAMAPDGSYLVFVSNRPANGEGQALDGDWGGKPQPGRGGNLWRVDRVGDGWGTPVRLSDVVSASNSTFSPAVGKDGSLYFVRVNRDNGAFRLYRSRCDHTACQVAQPLALGAVGDRSDYDPAVAPDQSFIVFSSDRPPAPSNGGDLFIAYATPGGWSAPMDLGVAGDEARLGADRNTLYYSAPDHHIHRVSLAPWLQQHTASR